MPPRLKPGPKGPRPKGLTNNLRDIEPFLKKLTLRAQGRVNAGKKRIARAVVQSLATNSPVDTSKLVSNWRVTLRRSSSKVIEPHFPGKGGATRGPSTAKTIMLANARINLATLGQVININNRVEYLKYQKGLVSRIGTTVAEIAASEFAGLKFNIDL